jgi:flagellar biosynthesis chaperone FliJ
MASLKEVIAGRKKDLRQLNLLLRSVDSAVEKTQRKIKRLTSRKTKVPELADLVTLTAMSREIETAYSSFVNGLSAAGRAWQS